MTRIPDGEFLHMEDPAGTAFPPQPRTLLLPLRVPFRLARVQGGPWKKAPGEGLGVCMAAEQCVGEYVEPNLLINVADYGVPKSAQQVRAVLRPMLQAILNEEPVYVGCGWGRGRTGLLLALLAKLCGARNPVQYVRENYLPVAVETETQEKYVAEFDLVDLPWLLRRKLWRRRLTLGLLKV